VAAAAGAGAADVTLPGAEWLLDQVKILTAPETDGRAAGTAGAERAARHIAAVFHAAGLAPGGDPGSYRQAFTVPTGVRLGAPNSLSVAGATAPVLTVGRDFMPLTVSSDGDESGELVFAGYGITAPDLHYDDYARLDAKGKIVLALSGEPRPDDPAGPFRRPTAYHYTERRHKIINAREHGARAIILVPRSGTSGALLPELRGVSQPAGIAAVAVTGAVADALLSPSGQRLDELADAIDRGPAPHSLAVPGTRVKLEVRLVRDRGPAWNVVGVLPGTDPRLAREAIVVGAHYDHLGRGGEGALAPDQLGVAHPGADDNASGTAAVLALARAFAASGGAARTLVFAAFSGEEMGLLGSSHYVRTPPVGQATPVLMVNLDMVGRLRDGKLYVAGVDSGDSLRGLVADAARGLALSPELNGDPFSPSDHTVFYTAGVPVLFLFTGAHGDYHRPSDTWDKLNPQGLETVTAFAARVVAAAAAAGAPPAYVRLKAPAGGQQGGGYGPYFGIVPDFGESEAPGTRVGGVRPGSPAEKAGVRAGDFIVEFAGVAVKNLEDLTFALRGQRPGQRVLVVIVRGGQRHRMEALLEERR
jgi:aminopeptidase YwaD